MNIDLSKNENLLSEEFVKVGLEAKKFRQITQSFKLLANLKKQARYFPIKIVEKLPERSPLKVLLPLYMSSLLPFQII